MVTLKVGNIYTDVVGDISKDEYKALQRAMSFRPQGYQFSKLFNRWIYVDGKKVRRMWDGWKRLCWRGKKRTYFPTGLLSIAKQYFKDHKIDFQIVGKRVRPEPNYSVELAPEIQLRPYQKDVVNSGVKLGRGIIQSPTGSGKTVMAAGLIASLKVKPFVFFVTSIDLLTQAKEEFERLLQTNGSPIHVGQIGGGVIDFGDVTVMTVQTAVRALGEEWDEKHKFDADDTDDKTNVAKCAMQIQELMRTAKGVICDEVQHWRAETCQLVCRNLEQAYFTFGCSATPWRDEGDDLVIQSCFGRKIVEISASRLIREGYLIRPSIKMVHVLQTRSKYMTWQKIYQDRVTENKPYNGLIANIAQEYVNNNRLVLLLVQRVKHGKSLERLIKGATFVSGNSPKSEREQAIRDLRGRQIKCLISTVIFDEGIDVKPLDTVILAGQGKSRVRAMQRIGRIMRPYSNPENGEVKTRATAIDFSLDNEKYLSEHAYLREKMYRTEEEYGIEHIDVTLPDPEDDDD
jgi:superfamily II DNA or RNA helicase